MRKKPTMKYTVPTPKTHTFQVNLFYTNKYRSACGTGQDGKPIVVLARTMDKLFQNIKNRTGFRTDEIVLTFQPDYNITIGDQVTVPSPSRKDDYWKHEFQGRVHCFRGRTKAGEQLVCVIDQDDNGWDVEINRLIK